MKKLPFKAASLVLSVLSGMLAGAVFKQVWKLIAGEEDAPEATDPQRSWKEILLAAALHGAVFAVVQAAVDRGAAQGARRLRRSPADDG
jgi:predicted metal-dependent enzyme (double-stranded beta helix superfamily)